MHNRLYTGISYTKLDCIKKNSYWSVHDYIGQKTLELINENFRLSSGKAEAHMKVSPSGMKMVCRTWLILEEAKAY